MPNPEFLVSKNKKRPHNIFILRTFKNKNIVLPTGRALGAARAPRHAAAPHAHARRGLLRRRRRRQAQVEVSLYCDTLYVSRNVVSLYYYLPSHNTTFLFKILLHKTILSRFHTFLHDIFFVLCNFCSLYSSLFTFCCKVYNFKSNFLVVLKYGNLV